MLEQPFIAAVNHLLTGATWATRRLAPHAGKSFRIDAPPLRLRAAIDGRGLLRTAPADTVPAVTLAFAPSLLPRLLARDPSARSQVRIEGDSALASEIDYLFSHLRWDVEDDLARIVGDAAARRATLMAEAAAALPGRWADSLSRSAAHYWTREDPMIAPREEVARFVADVDTLRDEVERLAKRIERLERGRPASAPAQPEGGDSR